MYSYLEFALPNATFVLSQVCKQFRYVQFDTLFQSGIVIIFIIVNIVKPKEGVTYLNSFVFFFI